MALMLSVSVASARKYLRDGLLPGARLSGRWFVSREAVVKEIERLSRTEPSAAKLCVLPEREQ